MLFVGITCFFGHWRAFFAEKWVVGIVTLYSIAHLMASLAAIGTVDGVGKVGQDRVIADAGPLGWSL